MTVSPDGSLETPGDDLPSNEVTPEEIKRWLAAHPGAAGLGIAADIILAEKDREMRRVAAEKVRATRLDLTDEEFERLAMDAQPKLSGRRETMVAELRAIVAAYRPPARGDDNTVADRPSDLPRLAAAAPPRQTPGPALIVSREEVEECRAALLAAGKPHGHRAIADALAVSVATVRRRRSGH